MVTPELIVEQQPDFQHMSSKIYQADTLVQSERSEAEQYGN